MSVIGTALEEFTPTSTTEGKVLVLLRVGWVSGGREGELLQGNLAVNLNVDKLVVKGHAAFGRDTVGRARIAAGAGSVRVVFEKEYNSVPIVIVTPREAAPSTLPDYHVQSDMSGFTIIIDQPIAFDLEFNWQAFGVEGELARGG